MIQLEIYLVSHEVSVFTSFEVKQAEQKLGLSLPNEYYDIMKNLGYGMLNDFFTIHTPKNIVKETKALRAWLRKKNPIHTEEYLSNLISIGSSIDGDTLSLLLGKQPEYFYYKSHDFKKIHFGNNLKSALTKTINTDLQYLNKSQFLFFNPNSINRTEIKHVKHTANHEATRIIANEFLTFFNGFIMEYEEGFDCFFQPFGIHFNIQSWPEDDRIFSYFSYDKKCSANISSFIEKFSNHHGFKTY